MSVLLLVTWAVRNFIGALGPSKVPNKIRGKFTVMFFRIIKDRFKKDKNDI